jgi:PTH1 family peptidyl-tRNA hydrolase
MNLIIGLGNPGRQHENTRHNVGFMVLDKISNNFKFVKKFNCEIAKLGDAIFAKPQTFMNLSGQAVQAIMSFYKINSEDLVVIHDDLDIELGDFKIQKNRSSAGHNGVQSIIDSIGTKDFTRIRVGIKNEQPNIVAEKFVLGRFGKEELGVVSGVIEKIKVAIHK